MVPMRIVAGTITGTVEIAAEETTDGIIVTLVAGTAEVMNLSTGPNHCLVMRGSKRKLIKVSVVMQLDSNGVDNLVFSFNLQILYRVSGSSQ